MWICLLNKCLEVTINYPCWQQVEKKRLEILETPDIVVRYFKVVI
jgi:hypothetical protein